MQMHMGLWQAIICVMPHMGGGNTPKHSTIVSRLTMIQPKLHNTANNYLLFCACH